MQYFPAMGTAGLERCLVKGNNLSPLPPPKIIPNRLLELTPMKFLTAIQVLSLSPLAWWNDKASLNGLNNTFRGSGKILTSCSVKQE